MRRVKPSEDEVVILGAGLAGLAAGFELSGNNVKVKLIEKNDQVGGLARTVQYKGNYFDIGPHRFYTKNDEINKLWHDLLGENLIKVPRVTRILYNKKLFHYPLKPLNTLLNLGVQNAVMAILSFAKSKTSFKKTKLESFEEIMSDQFGRKLFEVFFKTYTEKIWGLPCSEISAEWATQRIRGLNLGELIRNAFFGKRTGKTQIKSLIEHFDYPLYGAGMMYEEMKNIIESRGGIVDLQSEVIEIQRKRNSITKVFYKSGGTVSESKGSYYLSSIPITELILKFNPPPPSKVLASARRLYFRDHISVNLIVEGSNLFPDNWIYIHSPEVKMARITNYGNFSTRMVKNKNTSIITVEYFCFKDDSIWKYSDKELLKLARNEIQTLGFFRDRKVTDGFVVREKDCYPVYYLGYKSHLELLKNYLSSFKNLQTIGRGGMYKYNNQDHSILTGLYAAKNLLGANYNVWNINTEGEYLETKNVQP